MPKPGLPMADDALLELLARALDPGAVEPTDDGLAALHAALHPTDREHDPAAVVVLRAPATRPVLRHRMLAAAAAVILIAVLVLVFGRSQPSGLTSAQLASDRLTQALESHSSATVTARDIQALAGSLDQLTPSQKAQLGPRPARVLAQACSDLAAGAPSAVPPACRALPARPGGSTTDTSPPSGTPPRPAASGGGSGTDGTSGTPAPDDHHRPRSPGGLADRRPSRRDHPDDHRGHRVAAPGHRHPADRALGRSRRHRFDHRRVARERPAAGHRVVLVGHRTGRRERTARHTPGRRGVGTAGHGGLSRARPEMAGYSPGGPERAAREVTRWLT